MGARGPVPKSNVVRLREGNPGKRRTPEPPKPKPVAPSCPAHLPATAKTQWRKVVPELERAGLATAVDGPTLEIAFMAYALARKAAADMSGGVTTKGRQPAKHPAMQVFRDAASSYLTAAKAMGMTAEARQRMVAPEVPGRGEEDDGFDT